MTLTIHAPKEVGGLPVVWAPEDGFQVRALSTGTFESLWGGAAGPGKTDCLIAYMAGHAQHPKARGLFLRTSFTDLRDVLDRMHVLYPQMGAEWKDTEKRWIFPSGGMVECGYGESMKEVGRYLGREFTGIAFDEIAMLPEEKIWQMLLSRIRSTDPTVPLRARASANPIGPGRTWLRERFLEKCGKFGEKVYKDADTNRTRSFIPGTSRDNKRLPASYWDGMADLPPSVREALRNGDWDMALGLFYPELLSLERLFLTPNQVPPLLDWYEFWGGYDWGFVHPATFGQYVRVKNTILKLDTLYMHRYQDDEQAATIKGSADVRCLRTVFAGHDVRAKRQAHSAVAETVQDVFARYSINLELANIDKLAGAKVLRRFFAEPKPGPAIKGLLDFRFVDTLGNRRCVAELAALVPDELNPNVPAKRDANETGKNGDDGADETRYGLATPTFEPEEPLPLWSPGNIADGKAEPAPWEMAEMKVRMPDEDGRIDKREYIARRHGADSAEQQFGGM